MTDVKKTIQKMIQSNLRKRLRHIGVCNFSAADLVRAHGVTTRTHWASVVSNQVHYSLTARDVEHEIAQDRTAIA